MRYPLRSRLLILFFFICCVALCQYIEATKFRDGARGKLARGNEGNLPTTHTSLPANLSSALTLKPFKPGTLYFLGSPLLLLHSCVFSCFLYRCGDTSFLFCTLLISLLPLLRLPSPPSAAAEQRADVWQSLLLFLSHTHKFSAACTAIAWSVFTLPLRSEWLFSTALVCASLLLSSGFESTQFALLWPIIFRVPLYCQ